MQYTDDLFWFAYFLKTIRIFQAYVPAVECSPPPFQKGNIKYEVGQQVTTVVDLLEWNEDDNDGRP